MNRRHCPVLETLERKALLSAIPHGLASPAAMVHELAKTKVKTIALVGSIDGTYATTTPDFTGIHAVPNLTGSGTVAPLGKATATASLTQETSSVQVLLQAKGKRKVQISITVDPSQLVLNAFGSGNVTNFYALPETGLTLHYTVTGVPKGVKNLAKSGTLIYAVTPDNNGNVREVTPTGTFHLTFVG